MDCVKRTLFAFPGVLPRGPVTPNRRSTAQGVRRSAAGCALFVVFGCTVSAATAQTLKVSIGVREMRSTDPVGTEGAAGYDRGRSGSPNNVSWADALPRPDSPQRAVTASPLDIERVNHGSMPPLTSAFATCGDDLTEAGEECDGTDDAACPGNCFPATHPSGCTCHPPVALDVGFESSEGFTLGYIDGQQEWTPAQYCIYDDFGICYVTPTSLIEGRIDGANPAAGAQHLRLAHDPDAPQGRPVGAVARVFTELPTQSSTSVDASIAITGGAEYSVTTGNDWTVTFRPDGQLLVDEVETGSGWTAGAYKNLTVCFDPFAEKTRFFYDGQLVYTRIGLLDGLDTNRVSSLQFLSDNNQCDGADYADFDNLIHTPGLSALCPPEFVCGDGFRDQGEECDQGDDHACPGVCQVDCTCPAPACGNDSAEAGEDCDGLDDDACPGLCRDSCCSCPPPTCGNDLVEEGEECDGSSDAACPGRCGELGGSLACVCQGVPYHVDFEPEEGFCSSLLDWSGGEFGPAISALNPSTGLQHLRFGPFGACCDDVDCYGPCQSSPDCAVGEFCEFFYEYASSPSLYPTPNRTTTTIDISRSAGFTDFYATAWALDDWVWEILFYRNGDLEVHEGSGAFVATGSTWTPSVYQTLTVCDDRSTGQTLYILDGSLLHSQITPSPGSAVDHVVLTADRYGATTGDFDNISVLPGWTAACTGATWCGNNLTEGVEACDGTDDAACPGLCAADCTCPPSLELSIGLRETGSTAALGADGGTGGTIEWLDLDGQTLFLDGVWRQYSWDIDLGTPSVFTGNGVLDGVGGTLEHLRVRSTGHAGPFNIWMDDLQLVSASPPDSFSSDFEGLVAGTEILFRSPDFSSSTEAYLVSGSSAGIVNDANAHAGSGSLLIDFGFVDSNVGNWLRLTTFNATNIPNPTVSFGTGAVVSVWFKGTAPTASALATPIKSWRDAEAIAGVATCGNDVVEPGEECDGTSDSACAGLCQTTCCTCPRPICGNNVSEIGEACDGTSDAACPGNCSATCECPTVYGFEPEEGFSPGFLDRQGNWTSPSVSSVEPHIETANPKTGTQHLRLMTPDFGAPQDEPIAARSPRIVSETEATTAVTISLDVSLDGPNHLVMFGDCLSCEREGVYDYQWNVSVDASGSLKVGSVDTGIDLNATYAHLTICHDPASGSLAVLHAGNTVFQTAVDTSYTRPTQFLRVYTSNSWTGDFIADIDNVSVRRVWGDECPALASATCGNGVVELFEKCDGLDVGYVCVGGSTPGVPCDPLIPFDQDCPDLGSDIGRCRPTCATGVPCRPDCTCPPAFCGNDIAEAPFGEIVGGEECDGTDDSSCPEKCQTDCTCPVLCGNGVLDAGEECDEFIETATCDADCTLPVCGDGRTNEAAGETCDDAGESAACDADCTPAECGDAYANAAAGEECDASDDSACPGECRTNCICLAFGACCVESEFLCCEVSNSECDALGGRFGGEGSTCETMDPPCQSGNVLGNPSFDNNGGSLTGWSTYGSVFRVSSQFESAPAAVMVFGNFTGTPTTSGVEQSVATISGARWSLRVDSFVRLNEPLSGSGAPDNNYVTAKMTFLDAFPGGNELGSAEIVIADGTFTQDVWHYNAPITAVAPAGTQSVRAGAVYVQPAGDTGTVLLDNFVLEQLSTACFTCGDGTTDPGEECDDGGESAACDADCTLASCGDDYTNTAAGEECDGADDTACPGACLGDCTCGQVCGNGNVETGEECDGSDDSACPGNCTPDCDCAFCGDNLAEGAEQCDGTDDAACPGQCQLDCTCGVDPEGACCVGGSCSFILQSACTGTFFAGAMCGEVFCPFCGDGTVDPGEQCDGSDDAACPGACGPTCTCTGNVIYVDQSAAGMNDGTSWDDAFNDLQAGLAAASSGKQIWVAAGVYHPAGLGGSRSASFQLSSGVEVYGGFAGIESGVTERDAALNVTTLSGDLNDNDGTTGNGENSYHVVNASGVNGTGVLDGFTITAGNADGVSPDNQGGGMISGRLNVVGSPTVVRCRFVGNVAASGGGMVNLAGSAPTVEDCEFVQNTASGVGGGVYSYDVLQGVSSPSFTRCVFTNNAAPASGGGAVATRYTRDSFTDCVFVGNSTDQRGGGVYLRDGSYSLRGCTFEENNAAEGGGLQLMGPNTTTLTSCVFRGNSARFGGGVSCVSGSTGSFVNCLFHDNTADDAGGALLTSGNGWVTMINGTFGRNTAVGSGGGFRAASGANIITNSVFWGNSDASGASESAQISVGGGSVAVTYTLIQGLSAFGGGVGNIGGDPLFAGAAGGDFHLSVGSPAVDAGDNGPVTESLDLDGGPRVVDGDGDSTAVVDMGVFETPAAPVCGNNVTETGETCDGTDDAACPGQCQIDCTCASACAALSPPTSTPSDYTTDRYLTFAEANPGQQVALRVTMVDLPPPYDAFNGTVMWVGASRQVSELGGLSDATPPTFTAATLQCDPFFDDWGAVGTVNVYHKAIVPGGFYEVQAIESTCDAGSEASYSTALALGSGVWGDVVGQFDVGAGRWADADGSVDVATDVVSVLDKFGSLPGSPGKARADLEPATPDQKINITDVTVILDAFAGADYPFPPGSVPCSPLSSVAALGAARMADVQLIAAPDVTIELIPIERVVRPGDTVTVDVFASGGVDVRSYQVSLALDGGTEGALVQDDVYVDTGRRDFLFRSAQMVSAVDVIGSRIGAALIQGGANMNGRAYLGSFTLRTSKHAAGTFRLRTVLEQDASLMRSSSNESIQMLNSEAFIRVASPRLNERLED